MTVYNTGSDAANTAVRGFLTKIGEYYFGRSFNTGSSGPGKRHWLRIMEEVFDNTCAYCGISGVQLSMEHLIMFNKDACGLHHPGNIVPCCKNCNTRRKDTDSNYVGWEIQFSLINESLGVAHPDYQSRLKRIQRHIQEENYPNLTMEQMQSIRILSKSLYESVISELNKSLDIYRQFADSTSKSK